MTFEQFCAGLCLFLLGVTVGAVLGAATIVWALARAHDAKELLPAGSTSPLTLSHSGHPATSMPSRLASAGREPAFADDEFGAEAGMYRGPRRA